MEENETIAAEYTKGFNEGYIISKHQPDLAEKLANAVGDNDRGQGFKDGRKELLLELLKDSRPKWLTRDFDGPTETIDTERELDKDHHPDLDPDPDI